MNSTPPDRPSDDAQQHYDETELERLREQLVSDWWEEHLEIFDVPAAPGALDVLMGEGCVRTELLQSLQSIHHADGPLYSSSLLAEELAVLRSAESSIDRLLLARVGFELFGKYNELLRSLGELVAVLTSQQRKLMRKPNFITDERIDELLIYIGGRTKTFNAEATATLLRAVLPDPPKASALKTRLSRLEKPKGGRKRTRQAAPEGKRPRGRPRKVKQFEDRTKHSTGNKHIFQTRLDIP